MDGGFYDWSKLSTARHLRLRTYAYARHWSLLIRKPDHNNEGAYKLYYYDSLNDQERAYAIERLFNGNLYNQHRDKWHNIQCSYQIGRTCGAATALNAAAAMEWPDDMGEHIQEKLEQVHNRDILSRAWVKACLYQKSAVSLQWIDDETTTGGNIPVAPPTPGTTTPAPKRHQPNSNHLNEMAITPTAPKPERLEFTLQMPDDKRGETSNKRGNRSYKTPAKSTNDGKRPTKKDDHTPIQIKGLKKKQRSKNISEQQKMTRKPKQKIPKKASKSYNKKEAKKKTKTKRGGQQKKRQSQASKYDNTATP